MACLVPHTFSVLVRFEILMMLPRTIGLCRVCDLLTYSQITGCANLKFCSARFELRNSVPVPLLLHEDGHRGNLARNVCTHFVWLLLGSTKKHIRDCHTGANQGPNRFESGSHWSQPKTEGGNVTQCSVLSLEMFEWVR